MNFSEARSLAVQGHRVRAVDMQPGAFIYYDFAGLRINIGGNSSGWSPRPRDEEAEWEDVPYVEVDPMDIPQYAQMFGRATRPVANPLTQGFIEPVGEVMVIDHASKWGLKPTSIFPMGDTPLGQAVARPDPAPANVGKWGTGAVPKRDAWGRPTD